MTLFRWVQRFTPLLIDAARPCRHSVGSHWFVDETYVKVSGSWRYAYRDELRSALLRRVAEIAEVIPFFGSIMASSDPAITGQFITGPALIGLTYELQKAAEAAEPSAVAHLRTI